MTTINRIEDIQAWQKARELVRGIYQCSRTGSLGKDFGLRDQIQRAAVSTMSNIAEGFGRKSDREFSRYLDIARGSAFEVQSLLYVAQDCGYIEQKQFIELYRLDQETISLIAGFTSYLRNHVNKSDPKTSYS